MSRRRGAARTLAMHVEIERLVAEALGQSEPGPRVGVEPAFSDGKPPRYPAIGLHPGAIEGSVPHLVRRLDHWQGRRA